MKVQLILTILFSLLLPAATLAHDGPEQAKIHAAKGAGIKIETPAETAKKLHPRLDPAAATVTKSVAVLTRLPLSKNYEEDVWYMILGRVANDRGILILKDMGNGAVILYEDDEYRRNVGSGHGFSDSGDAMRVSMHITKDNTADRSEGGDHGGPNTSWFYKKYPADAAIIAQIGTEKYPLPKAKERVDEADVWNARAAELKPILDKLKAEREAMFKKIEEDNARFRKEAEERKKESAK